MRIKRLVITSFVFFLTVIIAITVSSGSAPTIFLKANAANLVTCQNVLAQAIALMQNSCGTLGRNKACYGHDQVTAQATGNFVLNFAKAGDTAPIDTISTIDTSPLNITTGTWGLSLLKLQANLPDTLPGQNVTFLLYGNTHIDNASGDMSSFYFSSGLGTPDCKEAPHDGIVVKSPNHAKVTFTADGVQITIASTITLAAQANQTMTVGLIEGHAQVSTSYGSQTLLPGQTVSIPLAGVNGLTASGAPSKPITTVTNPLPVLVNAATQANAPTTIPVVGNVGQTSDSGSPVHTTIVVPPTSIPTAVSTNNSGNDDGNGNSGNSGDDNGGGNGNSGNGNSGNGGGNGKGNNGNGNGNGGSNGSGNSGNGKGKGNH